MRISSTAASAEALAWLVDGPASADCSPSTPSSVSVPTSSLGLKDSLDRNADVDGPSGSASVVDDRLRLGFLSDPPSVGLASPITVGNFTSAMRARWNVRRRSSRCWSRSLCLCASLALAAASRSKASRNSFLSDLSVAIAEACASLHSLASASACASARGQSEPQNGMNASGSVITGA